MLIPTFDNLRENKHLIFILNFCTLVRRSGLKKGWTDQSGPDLCRTQIKKQIYFHNIKKNN